MRRSWWSVGAIATIALAASSCASAGTSLPKAGALPTSSGVAVPGTTDPLGLVGSWQLIAPGQPAGSVLRLGDDLSLWSGCGYVSGEWNADAAGLFVGHVSGGDGPCEDATSGSDPTPEWLTRVVAFTTDSIGAQLRDATGAVVATLLPGGHPTAGPNLLPALAQPPTVTDDLRARLRAAAPLPAGLVGATPAQLLGHWVSAADPSARGFADLSPDGSWTGSDGANGQGGRWAAAADGELVVVAGPQTAASCGPPGCADVGDWFVSASRAAFDGATLVLLDADGKVTGRAVHATSPSVPATSMASSGPVASSAVADASPASTAASIDEAVAYLRARTTVPIVAPTAVSGVPAGKVLSAVATASALDYQVNLWSCSSALPLNDPRVGNLDCGGEAQRFGSFGGQQESSAAAAQTALPGLANAQPVRCAGNRVAAISIGSGLQGMAVSCPGSPDPVEVRWSSSGWDFVLFFGSDDKSWHQILDNFASHLHAHALPPADGVFAVTYAADGAHSQAAWAIGSTVYTAFNDHSDTDALDLTAALHPRSSPQ